MKKSIFVWSVSAMLFAGANAQTSISGLVQSDEAPLPGVSVVITGSGLGTVTGRDGRFQLGVPTGTNHQLVVSSVGYKRQVHLVDRDTVLELTLEEGQELSEVIVRGIRGNEKSPVSQKTMLREEIQQVSRGQDAQFVLEQLSPSLITTTQSGNAFGNYGSMRLRGIDDSRINITLNGAPLNDMIDQSVYFSNMPDFINSMQSVQVQRGTGTSSNGLSSYAGSISFESVDIFNAQESSEVALGAGSFSTYRGSVAHQTGIRDNNTAFYSRFSKSGSEGYRYNSSNESYSAFFSGGYKGSRNIWKATAFFGNSKNGQAYKPIALSDIKKDPRTNYKTANEIDDYSQWMAQAQHSYAFHPRLSLQSTAYYGGAYGYYPWGFEADSIMYWGYKAESNYIQAIYPLTNDHYGVLSNISYTGEQLTVDGGLHGYSFQRTNKQILLPNYISPFYYERSEKNELSAFAKASYRLGDLTLFGDVQVRALQLTMYPDQDYLGYAVSPIRRSWNFINPKAGVQYALNPFADMYFSWGSNAREPARIDILGGYEINAVSDSIARDAGIVKPEQVNDLELGYRFRKKNYRLHANVFYMMLQNEIAEIGRYIDAGYVQLRKNMPRSYRRGLELDGTANLTQRFSVYGNMTYMQSEIEEYAPDDDTTVYRNVKPALCPDLIGRIALGYRILKNLHVEISGKYISEMFLEPTNNPDWVIPASWVMDAKATYTPSQSVTLNLRLLNLGNSRYYTAGAPVGEEPGYFVQAPFHLFGELIVRF